MALLEVRELTKDFGGLRAVNDLSFVLEAGEILGLIGPNGAGKTTVFNLIAGFLNPNRGKVLFKGQDLVGLKPYAVTRRGVARTFQIVKPFRKLSVLENVTLAAFLRHRKRKDAEAEGQGVLEQVRLDGKRTSLAEDLTLGEQKRLEIARALATKPELLLLDEPMGGLNPTEIDQAAAMVRDICREGVTIIWVEHVLKAIMNSSHRVVVIHHGVKIADAPPAEVVKNPEVVAAYLGSKAESYVAD